jgi:hypothetical protein
MASLQDLEERIVSLESELKKIKLDLAARSTGIVKELGSAAEQASDEELAVRARNTTLRDLYQAVRQTFGGDGLPRELSDLPIAAVLLMIVEEL